MKADAFRFSLSLITIEGSNDANELDSEQQRREIENGEWTKRKRSVRVVEGRGREREREGETVLDAFAKPLETVLHNNLLEKWQRDAKMSETTTNSDDFFPPYGQLNPCKPPFWIFLPFLCFRLQLQQNSSIYYR